MEIEQLENGKKLQDNLNKCRCCFRMVIDANRAVSIDENIRHQFFCLTGIELLSSDMFSSRICQLCKSDLQAFSDLRKDLLQKQTELYGLAGLDVQEQVVNDINEDYEMQVIEKLEDTADEFESEIILENDEYSESEIVYEDKGSAADDMLRIEKIEEDHPAQEDESEYLIDYYANNSGEETQFEQSAYTEDSIDTEICQVCNIEVIKESFKEHVETMHTGDNICSYCQLQFVSKILLRKHINEDHTEDIASRKAKRKLQYCPLCSKEYDYKKQLMDHIRSFHKKERNTQCPICKRKFYHRDLKKHIKHVHGEKKISCHICGKMFTCQENLKLHLKYHSEPKYMCQQPNCGKKFHQKILYEHHLVKHKDERTVSCNDCDKTFFTVRDLKRHNQRVHTKVTRKCFSCEMVFCRKDKYRDHVIKHHRDLTDESRAKILEEIKNLKWHEVNSLDDEC